MNPIGSVSWNTRTPVAFSPSWTNTRICFAYLKQHQYANATAEDFWDAQAKTSKKPVDRIMPTWVKQAGEPIIYEKESGLEDAEEDRGNGPQAY